MRTAICLFYSDGTIVNSLEMVFTVNVILIRITNRGTANFGLRELEIWMLLCPCFIPVAPQFIEAIQKYVQVEWDN